MADYVLVINKDKEFLRDRADEIALNPEIRPQVVGMINDLKDTLIANKNLVALSAPQLGKKERIFAIKFADGDIRAFINPAIIRTNGMHLSRERAIGLGDEEEYLVPRADEIFATYQTPDMIDTCDMNKFTGAVAEVFQQMNDLLNGILLEDIGLIVLPEWDKASDEEKQDIIKMYFENLEAKKKIAEEKIEQDKDAKKLNTAIEFMTKMQLGEIETIPLTEEEMKRINDTEVEKEKQEDGQSI